jgi:membrane protease YdiL (CAAX protease family)
MASAKKRWARAKRKASKAVSHISKIAAYPLLHVLIPLSAPPIYLSFLEIWAREEYGLDLMNFPQRHAFLESRIHPLAVMFATSLICLAIILPLNLKRWRMSGFVSLKAANVQTAALCLLLGASLQLGAVAAARMGYPDHLLIYGANPAAALLISGVLAPAAQELAFRGIVYGRLKLLMRRPFAAALQAMIFAMSNTDPGQIPFAFFSGVAFALALDWTGSVWAPVLAHAGFGSVSALMALQPQGYPMDKLTLALSFLSSSMVSIMALAKLKNVSARIPSQQAALKPRKLTGRRKRAVSRQL